MSDDVKVEVWMPEEERRLLKAAAAMEGLTMSEVTRRALQLWHESRDKVSERGNSGASR